MQTTVSITSQGQLTIPKNIRERFGIKGSAKAHIRIEGEHIVVEPQKDFWSLSGSGKGSVSLPDKKLREAREAFKKTWPRKSSV